MWWPVLLWSAVTLRDGIGADDLIWLAGLVTAVSTICGFVWVTLVRPVRRVVASWSHFSDTWHGQPAAPGFAPVPGVPERIQRIEREVQRNGGQTLKDRVFHIDRKLDQLTEAHAEVRESVAELRGIVESKEC